MTVPQAERYPAPFSWFFGPSVGCPQGIPIRDARLVRAERPRRDAITVDMNGRLPIRLRVRCAVLFAVVAIELEPAS
jgi:hypothetical protein